MKRPSTEFETVSLPLDSARDPEPVEGSNRATQLVMMNTVALCNSDLVRSEVFAHRFALPPRVRFLCFC